MEALEQGDKPSHSSDSPYFKFAWLRVGGEQVPSIPMGRDLYLDSIDPKDASVRLREAWWAIARNLFDGTPLPPSVRILALGDRRHGGPPVLTDQCSYLGLRYAVFTAFVWTGSQCGCVFCGMGPSYLDCSIRISGGMSEDWMRSLLTAFLRKVDQRGTFGDVRSLLHNFAWKMPEEGSWHDSWEFNQDAFDALEDVDGDNYFNSIFDVERRREQKSWSFGDEVLSVPDQKP